MKKELILATLLLVVGWLGAAPSTPYGICAHVTRGDEFKNRVVTFELLREVGVEWVRSDFDWQNIQPDPATWNFEHLDALVADAQKAGIQLLPILDYNSSFAKPAHKHLPQWNAYVRAVVERYQKQLPVWEVWNEQNLGAFWENPDPDAYLTLLKSSYQVIKSIDPTLKVAIGGFAGVPTNFIDRLYLAGAKFYFDIMNVHPYSHPAMPERSLETQLGGLKEVMAKHGDAQKPIWLTEFGWPTQRQQLAAPGLLKRALTTAKPDKRGPWRILVLDDRDFPSNIAPSEQLLTPELPPNSRVQRLTFDALLATLDCYTIDAVILPFGEGYPATGFDRLYRYMAEGGVLAVLGGAPFYYSYERDQSGVWQKKRGHARPDLRYEFEAWWYDKARIPEKMKVAYTGPAEGLPLPEGGITAERFIKSGKLKAGDRFIPLLTGTHNGYTGTAAAVVSYNSDLKGALILSALMESGQRGSSKREQAVALTRSMLIAQQLGVERLFWYEFQAPEVEALNQESHFGIVHRDYAPKPAYAAYKTLTALRPAGSQSVARPWKSEDGNLYWPQWIGPDKKPAGAVWAWREVGLFRVTLSSRVVKLVTYDGQPLAPTWEPGDAPVCVLSLNDEPIYVVGASVEKIEPVSSATTALRALLPNNFEVAAAQYRAMLARLGGAVDSFPRRWENGQLVTIGPREWTSGFFPGSLWYLYEYTGADEWKSAAMRYTAMLEQIRHYNGNHDIGFMLYCSYGNGLRLIKPEGYKEVLLDGAAALCTRFYPTLGMTRSWDNKAYTCAIIIDNMMNLELLMWAARVSGDKRFSEIAISHADQTNLRHFRADGSAYHIVDYDPVTRKIRGYHAGQGASADAPWARGQSWGLYGFTMMYRETKRPEYLKRAEALADFLLAHPNLPEDMVPYWDYQAAEIPYAPRDCSAAAIMASALLELSGFVAAEKGAHYRAAATRQLLSLSSPEYRAAVGENGNFLLKHGVGHLPGNSEIEVPLNYADYYYLEALLRFKRLTDSAPAN